MGKVYALISEGWDNSQYENKVYIDRCLGVFSSPELAVKAANDYLKKASNNSNAIGGEVYNVEGLILPNDPLTFDMLDVYREEVIDGYEYLNNHNMYGAYLYIVTYDLDKCYF